MAYADGEGDTTMNCTFSMYGRLRSLPGDVPPSRVAEYESELHNPSGLTVLSLSPPVIDAVLFSKDCNIVVELDSMEGLELDKFWDQAAVYAFILTLVTALQTWVLVRQMEYTSTPTVNRVFHRAKRASDCRALTLPMRSDSQAISKVSHLTIAMQVVIDVYFCVSATRHIAA